MPTPKDTKIFEEISQKLEHKLRSARVTDGLVRPVLPEVLSPSPPAEAPDPEGGAEDGPPALVASATRVQERIQALDEATGYLRGGPDYPERRSSAFVRPELRPEAAWSRDTAGVRSDEATPELLERLLVETAHATQPMPRSQLRADDARHMQAVWEAVTRAVWEVVEHLCAAPYRSGLPEVQSVLARHPGRSLKLEARVLFEPRDRLAVTARYHTREAALPLERLMHLIAGPINQHHLEYWLVTGLTAELGLGEAISRQRLMHMLGEIGHYDTLHWTEDPDGQPWRVCELRGTPEPAYNAVIQACIGAQLSPQERDEEDPGLLAQVPVHPQSGDRWHISAAIERQAARQTLWGGMVWKNRDAVRHGIDLLIKRVL